ncbi:auxin-binding protein [Roseateles aquatilis]|uniref:Auxin-binding protein n=1 Tax=Roseateles aquatilis TaxID=431061 RepID=A0A246JM57_9BURK|nr:cupin domain-containing protein [Roseateles aquatilis]OWQ93734.1 auxin-binding protein [Roseateles aquatilis]
MNDRAQALAALLIRNFHEAELKPFQRPPNYDARGVRLAPGTAARKLGASYDIVEPGKCTCPYHLHFAQEEMFIVLEGHGTLRVAGELLPIKAGDVMFIPAGPEYSHQILNTSDAPIKYLSISTMEQPEVCLYPDSGKFMAETERRADGGRDFEAIRKAGEGDLDYWHDEP